MRKFKAVNLNWCWWVFYLSFCIQRGCSRSRHYKINNWRLHIRIKESNLTYRVVNFWQIHFPFISNKNHVHILSQCWESQCYNSYNYETAVVRKHRINMKIADGNPNACLRMQSAFNRYHVLHRRQKLENTFLFFFCEEL